MSDHNWKYFQFKLKFKDNVRKIAVLAPNEEIARMATGAFDDERIELLKEIPARYVLCRKSKIPNDERIQLLKSLTKCIKSGASISKALTVSVSSVKSPLTRGAIGILILNTSKNGLSLSAAMEKASGFFDAVTIAIVKAGEKSGNLSLVLGDLAERLDQAEKIKKKVIAGLYYPAVVVAITLIAAGIVNFFVFPSILANFKLMGAQLPFLTELMVGIGQHCFGNAWLGFAVFGSAMTLPFFWKKIKNLGVFQRKVLQIPIIGTLIGMSILVRSLQALSLLQKSGTNVVEAYQMTITIAGNIAFKDYFQAVLEHIKVGDTPDRAFLKERYRLGSQSEEIGNLMRLASFTGEDWQTLESLSQSLAEEVKVKAESLPKLIEPLLITFIALVVGLMIAAIYLPSFYLLLNAFKH